MPPSHAHMLVYVEYFKGSGQVVYTIPNLNGPVTGITILNDRMYVSHSGCQLIGIYCPATFQFQQLLACYCSLCGRETNTIPCYNCGSNYGSTPQHIAACDINNCLYVSAYCTYFGSHIFKVAFGENSRLHFWPVVGNPEGLSVTSSHNLLVAMSDTCSVHEYTTDGCLVRQINLQPAGISNPVHSVQLSNDQFGVTDHGPTHQFSVVSFQGTVVQSYRGDAGEMNNPQGIAVDQRGRIFVADQSNNRILVMDSKTLSAHPLPLPTDCELNGPHSVHFDVVSRRLYIGEWIGGRIVCCQL